MCNYSWASIIFIKITITEAQPFHLSNRLIWIPYQILDIKTVKYVQIDPQTTEVWLKELFFTLSVSE